MTVSCLIRENKYDYAFKCDHIGDIVDILTIKKSLNSIKDGTFNIVVKGDLYYANKKTNPEFFTLIMNNKKHLTTELDYLKNSFSSIDFNEIVIYYLIELVILIELKNKNIIDLKSLYKYLTMLDYIPKDYLDNFKQVVFYKKDIKKNSFKKNINILLTNKNSYEFPRNLSNLKNNKMLKLINDIDLPLLEIPANKDTEKTIIFLDEMLQLKKILNLKKWNFSLRIKKTKKGNDGMYIKSANTIIIDPRHPDALHHELGHYIYENNLAFTYNNKRYYPCFFNNILIKFKKTNYNKILIKQNSVEDNSNKSEIFAIWFDSLLNDFNKKK